MELRRIRVFAAIFALVVSLMVAANPVLADDDCKTVRLDKDGGVLEHVPVYNQLDFAYGSDTDLCYATAAAQAIDACRAGKGDKLEMVTSPLSVTINSRGDYFGAPPESNTESKVKELFGTGTAMNAVNRSRRRPICDQKWLERYAPSFRKLLPARTRIGKAETLPSAENLINSILIEAQEYQAREARSVHSPATLFFCQLSGGSEANLSDIQNAIQAAVGQSGELEQITAFMDSICHDHSFTENCPAAKGFIRSAYDDGSAKTADDFAKQRNSRLITDFDSMLSKDGVPIMISYLANVLKDPDFQGIQDHSDGTYRYEGAMHVSLIVGRERNPQTGVCGYWVRNSYGPDCKKKGRPIYPFPCENGTILVDRERLVKNVYGVDWIPKH